ncbi:MAG: hypothetical protein LBS64_00710 [Spirochaetaceae bacterium]|nr:hypothetical protein [Spirochaetaceae bacterium]
MANWYYLAAQLPAIPSGSDRAPPLSGEAFLELCSRFLDKKSMDILRSLSLEPPVKPLKTGSRVVDSWNEMENSLRLALAALRAQKLNKTFDGLAASIRPEALQAARTAMGLDNPLAAEQFLNDFREGCIDRIAGHGTFSTETMYAYALKLKMLIRIRKFNEEAGAASYHKIYDHILGEAT